MNDEPELTRDEKRINGFAKGDRVAVVAGKWEGAVGKVDSSWAGCSPEYCRENCRLVNVELTHCARQGITRAGYIPRFHVADITHID